MTNKIRGEVTFDLQSPAGDKIKFTVSPSFKVLAALESALGCSITMATAKVRAGTLTFTDTIVAAASVARHANTPPDGFDKDNFHDRLFACGPLNVMDPVRFLIGETLITGAPEKNDGGAASNPT